MAPPMIPPMGPPGGPPGPTQPERCFQHTFSDRAENAAFAEQKRMQGERYNQSTPASNSTNIGVMPRGLHNSPPLLSDSALKKESIETIRGKIRKLEGKLRKTEPDTKEYEDLLNELSKAHNRAIDADYEQNCEAPSKRIDQIDDLIKDIEARIYTDENAEKYGEFMERLWDLRKEAGKCGYANINQDEQEAHEAKAKEYSKEREERQKNRLKQEEQKKKMEKLFLSSIEEGNIGEVKRLIAEGADVNTKDENGGNKLMAAAFWGHEGVVRVILDAGAEVNAKNNLGKTALMYAAHRKEYGKNMQMLLDAGAEVNAKNNSGQTALIYALDGGVQAFVQLLLDAGAEVDAKDDNGWTALNSVLREEEQVDIIKMLLDAGAEFGEKGDHSTRLIYAVENEYYGAIRVLVDSKVDINAAKKNGVTALMTACDKANEKAVRMLLDAGAEVNAKNSNIGQTALMYAARSNWYGKNVQILVDAGAEVNAKNSNGITALMAAAAKGNTTAVRMLLDAGAEFDAKDNDGETALMAAANCGHKKIVQMLLDAGAQVDSKDNSEQTALMYAAKRGHTDLVQILLDAGAQVDSKENTFGGTALMSAAQWSHKAVVQMLLDAGAEVDVKDNGGDTALSYAKLAIELEEIDSYEIMELLLKSQCPRTEERFQEKSVEQQEELDKTSSKLKNTILGILFAGEVAAIASYLVYTIRNL